MVEKAKHHIKEGDIFQIVLSNRLSAPLEGRLFDTYRVLRTITPSPYMFSFSGTDVEVAGASPETVSYTHLDVYKRQVLDKCVEPAKTMLFIEEADPTMERWYGRKVPMEEAEEISGIDRCV